MTRHSTAIGLAVVALAFSACSGGGGGSTPIVNPTSPPVTVTPTPSAVATLTPTPVPATASPTPMATATSQVAVASGKVVDFDSNTGLAGEPVAIAVNASSGGAYQTVATTGPDGSFTFTAAPNTYVVAIGTNASTDTTRATEHDVFTLYAGNNTLNGPIESPVPQFTPNAAQTSGTFRLAQLNSTEMSCFSGMNTGRTSNGLQPLIYDEESLEFSRAQLAEEIGQNTDTPTPLFTNYNNQLEPTGSLEFFTGMNFQTCQDYTQTYTFSSGSVPYQAATSTNAYWYAANWGETSSGTIYTNQDFDTDPREAGMSMQGRVRHF